MKEVRVVIPDPGWGSNSGQGTSDTSKSPLLHNKQPRPSADSAASTSGPGDVKPEGAELHGDDDAFTASEIEEFQQLASDKRSLPDVSSKAELTEQIPESPRLPTFISIQVPSSLGEEAGGTPTPHIFPAMRERPLTRERTSVTHSVTSPRRVHQPRVGNTALSADSTHHCLNPGVMLFSGYNRVIDPSSEVTTNHRLRMTPRAFASKLLPVKKVKETKKDKDRGMMVKPIAGRPGIVSLHGQVAREHQRYVHYKQHVEHDHSHDLGHLLGDNEDFFNTFTNFSNSTLASELQAHDMLTTRTPFPGREVRQTTVGDVMTRSRDRSTRHSRMPTSALQSDDWNVVGDNSDWMSPRRPSANDGSHGLLRSGTRSGKRNPLNQHIPRAMDCPSLQTTSDDTVRARTAPTTRHPCRHASNPTSWTVPQGLPIPETPRGRGHPLCLYPSCAEPEEDLTPRLNVVHLQLTNSPKPRFPNPPLIPRCSANTTVPKNSPQASTLSRVVFPYSADSMSHVTTKDQTPSFRLDLEKANSRTLDSADQEHSGQSKQAESTRLSRSARRWRDPNGDSGDKLKKWRIRMTFVAPRQRLPAKTFRV